MSKAPPSFDPPSNNHHYAASEYEYENDHKHEKTLNSEKLDSSSDYDCKAAASKDTHQKRRSLLLRPFSRSSRNSNSHNLNFYPHEHELDLGDPHVTFNKSPDMEAQRAQSPQTGVANSPRSPPQYNSQSQNLTRLSIPTFTHPDVVDIDDTDTDTDTEDNTILPGPIEHCEGSLSTCAICIDDMDEDDTVLVRGLSCGHIFHPECIDPWLLTRQACCPLCKASFYAPKPEDPLGPEPVEVIEAQLAEQQHASEQHITGPMRSLSRRLWGHRAVPAPEPVPVPSASELSEMTATIDVTDARHFNEPTRTTVPQNG